MMSFKLSLKNIRKSLKDYTIYFLTLILGVAIFYVFNALDSQTAMLRVSESTKTIMQLMVAMLSGVSVAVAAILGFLIVYANNFLIKRRKKEFAVYMSLGMGKRQISRILLGETMLIGLLSLGIGLGIGVCASQFMSILVSRMFEADLSAYTFVFSGSATWKTILYFGIMYVTVVLFNTFSVSRCRLIDLFQASKRTEKRRLKSSMLSVFVFLLAAGILGYSYYQVTVRYANLDRADTLFIIALGCVGTFLVFWSMSGFLLNLFKRIKSVYYRGLNAFVLRQVNSNINTSVFSMTVISLLLFVTICVLSSGLAMNRSLRQDLQELCPRDINFVKPASDLTVSQAMEACGADLALLAPGYVEVSTYTSPDLTYGTMLGSCREQAEEKYPQIRWNTRETIMGISEYNRLAEYYGQPVFTLPEDRYVMVCTLNGMREVRDLAFAQDTCRIAIGGRELTPLYDTCQEGFLYMNLSHAEAGILVVPDSVVKQALGGSLFYDRALLAADYAAESAAEKTRSEEMLLGSFDEEKAMQMQLDGMTKIVLYESSVGMASIVTFIAIYLGMIFLIAGAALLALKELAESTDNRQRYAILDQIGADKRMQKRALLGQMSIFFGMPMLVAVIHSIFGIQYAHGLLSMYVEGDLFVSILVTALVLLIVYGGYFAATYFGSRRILEEE